MDDRRWQEVKRILDEASRLATETREGFVRDACGEDEALREEVDSLLAFHDETRDVLGRPVFDVNAEDPRVGRRIGHYRIARLLGRGGMGQVYLAIREDDYSKQVAIKLIQRGLDADERIERFHEERQILADLEHPAIARLLDGGTTEDGLPYLVMELVEGEPIDSYCDGRRLGVRPRLELFRQVLEAVAFSHRHLVVHRDLKPGNVLVEGEGSPKLIDFGIAKLLRETPTAARPSRGPMSPRYASPEQVEGGPITTATDVYSLGVLLYKLLAGRHPYSSGATSHEDLVHAIRETTPILPSSAAWKASAAPEPRRRLAGDLDAIVMKALSKRPEERYASAGQFADDVDRYLSGHPVLARPGTVSYRALKFVRRHRLPVAAMILALLALASTFATLVLRSSVARERAQTAALETFVTDLFRAAGPDRSGGEEVTVRELLDRGRDDRGDGLQEYPLVRSGLLAVVGRVYEDLGELDDAELLLAEALDLQRQHDPGNDAIMARRENDLGLVLRQKGNLNEAEGLYRSALLRLGGCRSKHPDSVWIAGNLAWVRALRDDFVEAKSLIDCLRDRENVDPRALASLLNKLGAMHYRKGKLEEAEEALNESLSLREEHFGSSHTEVANVRSNLGAVLVARGKYPKAEVQLRLALEAQRLRVGADHQDTAITEKNLAHVLTVRGDPAAAEELARHALQVMRSRTVEAWRIAETESILGGCLAALRRCAEAEPLLSESFRALEKDRGDNSPETQAALERLNRWKQLCGSSESASVAPLVDTQRR